MSPMRTKNWPRGTRCPRVCPSPFETGSSAMPATREGQRVPQVTFRTRTESDWKNVSTDEIFKGKTVVGFSLPGAFTPTCSSTHVPRYNELAPAFFANGVDRIVCISVNDAFVMNEWARTQ